MPLASAVNQQFPLKVWKIKKSTDRLKRGSYIPGQINCSNRCFEACWAQIWHIHFAFSQYILQIFYPKNRTKSVFRIDLCAHDFYTENRLTKHSSILRIESYYTSVLACLHWFVLYRYTYIWIIIYLTKKYMMTTQYCIIYIGPY